MHDLIDEWIKNWLSDRSYKDSDLYKAVQYALIPGGKRFRPELCLRTCRLLGGLEKSVIPFAVSVELIHTYSLIHDDLPSMDDSDTRRGKPSLHKKFEEGLALLAGDVLLTEAFLLLSKNYDTNLVNKVSDCVNNMIYGQSLDIQEDTDRDIEKICNLKSGELIQCCVLGVCMICNTDNKQTELLRNFSKNLGLAFQIADDIKDQDKRNYVKVKGLEYSENKLKALLISSKKNLGSFAKKGELEQILDGHFKGFFET